jgi:hypothetical protein
LLGVALVAAFLLALAAGGLGRVGRSDARHDGGLCHAQVNCVGQVANTPLGSSALPVTVVAVVAALVLFTRFDLAPVRWHDRLAASRLFRPPRRTL